MKKQRRKFTNGFKLKVILDSLKEQQTMKELCQKYQLQSNQITLWKKDFLTKAEMTMSSKITERGSKGNEKENQELYAKIGKLQMEVDFLKKKLC